MAKKLSIVETWDSLEFVLDNQKMTKVLSYKLEGSHGRSTLTVVTEIMNDDITVKIEAPN